MATVEIPQRQQVEAEFFRRMRKMSKRHARELRQLLGNPPQLLNVPNTFWQRIRDEREKELQAVLILLFILAGDQARKQYASRSRTSKTDAAAWAEPVSRRIAIQHTETTKEKIATHIKQQRVADPERQRYNLDQITEDAFTPSRDEAITITETTAARQAAAEQVASELDAASEDDLWITEDDGRVCEICEPLHRKPRAVWASKFPSGPPAHPRCRCEVEYVKQEAAAD